MWDKNRSRESSSPNRFYMRAFGASKWCRVPGQFPQYVAWVLTASEAARLRGRRGHCRVTGIGGECGYILNAWQRNKFHGIGNFSGEKESK